MNLKEIEKAPEDLNDITLPPHLLKGLTPSEEYVVRTIHRMEKRSAWFEKIALDAYNMGVRSDNNRTTFISKAFWMIISAATGGLIATVFQHFKP